MPATVGFAPAALALAAHLHPKQVERFVAYDLLVPVERDGPRLLFEEEAVLRVQAIQRLRQDLGAICRGSPSSST